MKTLKFLCLLSAMLFLFSCSSRITGTLSQDGSAAVTLTASLGARVSLLIRTIAAAGGHTPVNLLDAEAISSSISAAPGVASASFRNTSPTAIEGTVRITRVADFLAGAGDSTNRFVIFEQGRIAVNLNKNNGSEVIRLLSSEIDQYLGALMAPVVTKENQTVREYLDLIELFYSKPIADEIAGSKIRASIDFPGTITEVKGGTFSGRRAEFDINLVDLLVLENPIELEVRWR